MDNIVHTPIFDTQKVIEHYSVKDGVDVKYVCTTAVSKHAEFSADVFYRDTPHPEFGNRYFALYMNPYAENAHVMITNADCVEDFDFGMIEDQNGCLHYSSHRHDYKIIEDKMIDGGRSYIRSGDHPVKVYKIKNGKFEEDQGQS